MGLWLVLLGLLLLDLHLSGLILMSIIGESEHWISNYVAILMFSG